MMLATLDFSLTRVFIIMFSSVPSTEKYIGVIFVIDNSIDKSVTTLRFHVMHYAFRIFLRFLHTNCAFFFPTTDQQISIFICGTHVSCK